MAPASFWNRVKENVTAVVIAATVCAVTGQLIAMIWWTSKLDSRVCNIEEWRNKADASIEKIHKMESCIENTNRMIGDIKLSIDRMSERMWELHKAATATNGGSK